MKVFFVLDALINAGTERSMLEIISKFSKKVEAKVIYFYPRHDLKDEYKKAGIPLLFLNLKTKRSFLRGTLALIKIIKVERPDVVVSSILRANLISRAACFLTKTKLIGTFVSDSYSTERRSSFTNWRKMGSAFFYCLDRFTAPVPVAWISNSASIKASNCASLKIDPEKVIVIYRGRDENLLLPWIKPETAIQFRFVFIGRLLQTKGLTELLKAFKLISQKYPDVLLDIYGAGSFKSTVEVLISSLDLNNKVELHGAVPNGWTKLYSAHCFIFPSWYEGFSGALVEAMMSGIPIIASDIAMNLEAVEHKKTALVHIRGSVESIADAMMVMLENYAEMVEMGKRARQIAIARFSITTIAKQYEKFLLSFGPDAIGSIDENSSKLVSAC